MVRDGREADLVRAQRQQEVSDPIGGRQVALGRPDAEAVDPLPAVRDEHGARLAEQPHAEVAALQRQAGLALELTLLVPEQVAEKALRDRLGALVARPSGRADRVRPAEGVQLRDHPPVREARQRDGHRERLERDQHDTGQRERHDERDRLKSPQPPPPAQPARVNWSSPRHRGELGEGGLGH